MNDLRVVLCVHEPSDIELDAREKVQLHRLACSEADGFAPEKHGDLLRPGRSRVRLEAGVYQFRTLTDARLRVVAGGEVTILDNTNESIIPSKDPWPTPPPPPDEFAALAVPWESVASGFPGRGDGPPGRVPALTIACDEGSRVATSPLTLQSARTNLGLEGERV